MMRQHRALHREHGIRNPGRRSNPAGRQRHHVRTRVPDHARTSQRPGFRHLLRLVTVSTPVTWIRLRRFTSHREREPDNVSAAHSARKAEVASRVQIVSPTAQIAARRLCVAVVAFLQYAHHAADETGGHERQSNSGGLHQPDPVPVRRRRLGRDRLLRFGIRRQTRRPDGRPRRHGRARRTGLRQRSPATRRSR